MSVHHTLREANIARQAEWDPSDLITLAYRGNELGGECGEAQNVIKKLERERLGIQGSRATVGQLAEELADVVICADLIAMAEGIDLVRAYADKFNATSEKVDLATRLFPVPAGDPSPWVARVMEVRAESEGSWVACNGCQESVDGHVSTKDYPFSAAFGCQPGGGCSECGGLGVKWDSTDWDEATRFMLACDDADEDAKTVTPAAVIAQVANVAHILGWQAGEAGADIAGGIVSYLAAHPDQAERFMREGGEMMIDGTIKGELGALTWRTATGEMMDAATFAQRQAEHEAAGGVE